MKIAAIRVVVETTENDIERLETVFEVKPNETVEQLMIRLNITGKVPWHFEQAEIRLKLVKE